MKNIKNLYIFGGGAVSYVTPHLALSSPAYGKTCKTLAKYFENSKYNVFEIYTKMAGGVLETNEDVENKVDSLLKDNNTRVIIFNCALVDWGASAVVVGGDLLNKDSGLGKYGKRLESNGSYPSIYLKPEKKIISKIRKERKDIFLVGFKTTCGATKQEMYEKGLSLCKESSVNLVLVNDIKTRWNMIITPEEAAYHETQDRDEVLRQLADMTILRSHLSFTQSTVINAETVKWSDERIPESIRRVVEHCIQARAYKPFKGATVGHFAIKLSDNEFLTSIRKSDFNKLSETGMVYVKTSGPDTVLAYGAKPSVGGQSQRIVFNDHAGVDCIVHFHSPLKNDHKHDIPVVSQREVECGSHECGRNTSNNLKEFILGSGYSIKCVMLNNHGPNIVFNRNVPAELIIEFINSNFDLSKKTGGYNLK